MKKHIINLLITASLSALVPSHAAQAGGGDDGDEERTYRPIMSPARERQVHIPEFFQGDLLSGFIVGKGEFFPDYIDAPSTILIDWAKEGDKLATVELEIRVRAKTPCTRELREDLDLMAETHILEYISLKNARRKLVFKTEENK